MANVSTYLNFSNKTEEAFNFYKKVFGTEFEGDGFNRFGDMPPQEGQPPMNEEDKKLIMHVSLPILGGYRLMGSDAPASMGFNVNAGNNVYINLEPDTREETDRLFQSLLDGGHVQMAMQDTFWGAYFGCGTDKFGVQWMFNHQKQQ